MRDALRWFCERAVLPTMERLSMQSAGQRTRRPVQHHEPVQTIRHTGSSTRRNTALVRRRPRRAGGLPRPQRKWADQSSEIRAGSLIHQITLATSRARPSSSSGSPSCHTDRSWDALNPGGGKVLRFDANQRHPVRKAIAAHFSSHRCLYRENMVEEQAKYKAYQEQPSRETLDAKWHMPGVPPR